MAEFVETLALFAFAVMLITLIGGLVLALSLMVKLVIEMWKEFNEDGNND